MAGSLLVDTRRFESFLTTKTLGATGFAGTRFSNNTTFALAEPVAPNAAVEFGRTLGRSRSAGSDCKGGDSIEQQANSREIPTRARDALCG